jgi:thiamine pyrophosphate-dependent acetolactate synthase large subunit-like protein
LRQIVDALTQSTFPVIVTSHVGRNPASVPLLSSISDKLGIPVFSACPSTLNVPFDHPMHAGIAYTGKFELIERADCLLVIDSDVPW